MSIPIVSSENRLLVRVKEVFQSEKTKKILICAGKALAELTIALTLNLIAMSFLATPISVATLTTALVAAIVSTLVQSAWNLYRENYQENSLQYERKVSKFSLMNLFSLAGPGILIHEAGHALASLSLFKHASPSVSISPLRGGSTSFISHHGLTGLGKILGYRRAIGVVCAGGMIASTLWCTIGLGASEGLREKSPMISEAIKIQSLLQIFNEIIEGVAVLIRWNRDIGSDFVRLWINYGVHPAIPVTLMIIIPVVTLVAIHFFRVKKHKSHFLLASSGK